MKTLPIRLLRSVCFAACLPVGGAFLANVYGIASMRTVTLTLALPACALLVAVWVWASRSGQRELAGLLVVGFLGGLLGTFAYDLARIPFEWAGYRLFVPISAYGVWIAGADLSSRLTQVIGWSYHFASGITFGIMYALFMSGRHWGWAIIWGLALETVAILSPFARIFSLSGNHFVIGIAYLGHVAYGAGLGVLVSNLDATREWLATVPAGFKWGALALACAAFVGPLLSPDAIAKDKRVMRGEFRVEGERLNPDWQAFERGAEIRVFNPGPGAVSLHMKPGNAVTIIGSQQRKSFPFLSPGIHQLYVKSEGKSRSSFVIVEPVAETR